MSSSPEYYPSDAWLLHTILLASGPDGATLKDMIAVGDVLNHAIFTANELNAGLERLIRGGWVKLSRLDNPMPTALATETHAKLSGSPFSVTFQWKKRLGVPKDEKPNAAIDVPPAGTPRYSERDISLAYEAYRKLARQS